MKFIAVFIIILILLLKVVFQIRIDIIDWRIYIYYWNTRKNKRMCLVI